jgi:hypothetical protein
MSVQTTLASRLDPELGRELRDRNEALLRGLRFLDATKSEHLKLITSRGYTRERLEVILFLAAFHHTIIGPLTASTRPTPIGLGSKTPVRHGGSTFDSMTAKRRKAMATDFATLLRSLEIRPAWIHVLAADDIVFRIFKTFEDRDGAF